MDEALTLGRWIDNLDRFGDQPALLAFGKDGVEKCSFAETDRLVERLSTGLADDGVGPDVRVALFASASTQWIIACLAVIRAGAVPVPIDVQFDDETLTHVLEDSHPRVVFVDGRRASRLENLDTGDRRIVRLDCDDDDVRSWQHLLSSEPRESAQVAPDAEAVLFYTSGTTGRPKGVPLTHENIASQIHTLLESSLLGRGDRLLLPLPLHHVYPLVMGVLLPMAHGASIALPRALTGPELARALKEVDVSVVIGVPRLYRALLDGIHGRARATGPLRAMGFRVASVVSGCLRRRLGIRAGRWLLRPVHRRLAPRLRALASGGAPLAADLAWELEALGWRVLVGYGLTETSPLLTLGSCERSRVGTVGRAVPGVELRIDPANDTDDSGQSPEVGEILARGNGVFSGYLHLPDETADAFTEDGWFRTGDLGRLDDDGYLYVHGRKDTLIVTSGGENLQPDTVEEHYAEHPAIREIGVFEENDRLVGLIVPDTSDEEASAESAIQSAVEERSAGLSSYARLADFRTTQESLPRTHLGKIQRHRLQKCYEEAGQAPSETTAEPMSIDELSSDDQALLEDQEARKTWELLRQSYPHSRLTPDSQLRLDLGVDSLEWLQLSMSVRRETGVELDDASIAELESVRDLLEAVSGSDISAEGEQRDDVLQAPESALDERQRRHLRPHGRLGRLVARALFSVNRMVMRSFFRLQVRGLDRLPDSPVVIAPNHVSYLDAPAIAAALPQSRLATTYWAGWADIMFANPLMRAVSRMTHAVPIDPERAAVSSLAFGAAVLDRGHDLVWFAEGECSSDGQLQRFQPGIGMLLEKQRVPAVPTAIQGAGSALPPGRWLPRRRRIVVHFGEPEDVANLAKGPGAGYPGHVRERAWRPHHERDP